MFLATGAIGTKKPSVSFRGSLFSDTINTRTFSTTIDLGTTAPSRFIVVGTACATGSGEEPTGCTVDGVSATKAIGYSPTGVFSVPVQLWGVANASGGSVTVAFTKPGGADMDHGSLAVWSCYNLRSQTARATNTGSGNPASVGLTVLANSLVFGVGAASNAGTVTWTLTGLTEDATDGTAPFQSEYGSASLVAAGSRTIEFGGVGSINACSAYWR